MALTVTGTNSQLWSLTASVKHCTTLETNKENKNKATNEESTVTFLLEAGGTSLVACMKKGVRVGGEVTGGWSEPCCEW